MNKPSNLTAKLAALTALSLGVLATSQAAIVPAGVVLHATQTLIRNNGSEPETLDPALAESVGANNITRDLFEGLTGVNGVGATVPGVAESWKQTAPSTWVFKLRPTARWSNGDAVTAEDFVFGIRRFLDPKTASSYASSFGTFLFNGADVVKGLKPPADIGVKAIDPLTLEVKTSGPVSFLPALMSNSNLGPVHKASLVKHGKDWTKPGNLVTNGAYMLKEWQVNSRVVLEKNPKYWDAANVQLTQVSYLPVEDGNADVKLYESGANEWVYQLPPGSYEKLKAQYPKEVRNAPMLGLRYYSYQTLSPVFKDVRVRKALSMVIDREILSKRVTADGQAPAYSLMITGVEGADPTPYDWSAWPMDKRVAEAKKLLEEAGVKPGSKFVFSYNTSDYHKKMAVFAASEWKTKLGLTIETESVEFKVLLKKRHDGDYQMARNGWVADYNDASTFLTLVSCDSAQNDTKYCDRKAQALIDEGYQTADPVKRKSLLTQASKQIMEGYPIIPLLQYSLPRLVKAYVGGYSLENAQDRFRSKDLYIIKH